MRKVKDKIKWLIDVWLHVVDRANKCVFLFLFSIGLLCLVMVAGAYLKVFGILATGYEPVVEYDCNHEVIGFYSESEYLADQYTFMQGGVIVGVIFVLMAFFWLRYHVNEVKTFAKNWILLRECFDMDKAQELYLKGSKQALDMIKTGDRVILTVSRNFNIYANDDREVTEQRIKQLTMDVAKYDREKQKES